MMRWLAAVGSLVLVGEAHAATVRASSELSTDDGRQEAELAFDGKLATGWAEGEPGTGEGAWLELRLDRDTAIGSVSIWPGNLAKGERTLKEDGRPHTITVTLDGPGEPVVQQVRLRDGADHGMQRVDVRLDAPVVARTVRLTIDQGYAGYLHNDTYIAEVALNLFGGEIPGQGRIDAWLGSSAAQRAQESHREAVIGLFGRITTEEFGDRDAMADLLAWASDGAPYLASRVARDVPYGFRVNALPPDEVAIQALLKIKDPNAIPALEMASLRTTGAASRKLHGMVTYFEAFAELKGGGRRGVVPWGVQGWEIGALRGFGEPLDLARGSDGTLWVADVGNHRVEGFDPDGRATQVLGAAGPEITDTWFGGRREHYVSGSAPGTKPGAFTNPIAVTTVPTRDGDELVVVDAARRVQWFDAAGGLAASFKVDAELDAVPGVGGAAHVVVVRGHAVVLWGNEAFVFDREGTETARWTIEDGAPITAVAMKNGRLLLGFRKGAAMYGTDGFRYGEALTGEELPLGYESWALAIDDKGKVWAVTDHGWAVKFKKPGKEDFKVQWSPVGVGPVRVVAEDDHLWISHDGTITPVDAQALLAGERDALMDLGE